MPHPTFYEIEKNIAFVVNKLNNLSVKFLITMYRMRFSIMLEAARLELEFTKYKNSR